MARREDRLRFWALIAAGLSSEDAAIGAGVSPPVGTRWFREAGGMPSSTFAPSSKPLSGRYLAFAEREEIALALAQDFGVREIARRLGRAASTVSRELRRNAATRSGGLEYRASTAQWHAERSARRPKRAKLAINAALRAYVQDRLAGKVLIQQVCRHREGMLAVGCAHAIAARRPSPETVLAHDPLDPLTADGLTLGSKVGIEDFGSWIYKRNTLQANELIIISQEGFTRSVTAHAKRENVRLGMLRQVETGFIRQIESTVLGTTRMWDKWWFASIFVQYGDTGEIVALESQHDYEEKIFGPASPMDLVRVVEKDQGDRPSGHFLTFIIISNGKLSYCQRPITHVMITAEKQRRIWHPKTRFFAYDEVYPNRSERGIAMVSEFRLDDARHGRMILVIKPDVDHVSGARDAHIAGQFEFT
jgi:Helix-turn-helix domain